MIDTGKTQPGVSSCTMWPRSRGSGLSGAIADEIPVDNLAPTCAGAHRTAAR